jgi:hypothetical protein
MFTVITDNDERPLSPEEARDYFRARINSGEWWIFVTDNLNVTLPIVLPLLVVYYGGPETNKKAAVVVMRPMSCRFLCRKDTKKNRQVDFPALTFVFCHKSVCPAADLKAVMTASGRFPPDADLSKTDMFYLLRDMEILDDVVLLFDGFREESSTFATMSSDSN